MFTCVSCGQLTTQHTHLSEDDADKRAIDDLGRQAKSLSGPMATLTRARRDQLIAEVSAERDFKRTLNRSREELVESLRLVSSSQDYQNLLRMDDDQLLDLILAGGLGVAVGDFIDFQDKIKDSVVKSLSIIEPTFDFGSLPELDLIQQQTTANLFDDVLIPDTKKAVRDAFTSLALDVPEDVVFSDLNERLKKSVGRQLTEVKTAISQYGRSINAMAGSAAGLNNYLYTGPMDGLTRPFCIPLVNKVVTEEQMNQLNNGQGLAVKTSGGGYNCRHSWSPVSEGFIISANLDRAKRSDILAANSRKAKRR